MAARIQTKFVWASVAATARKGACVNAIARKKNVKAMPMRARSAGERRARAKRSNRKTCLADFMVTGSSRSSVGGGFTQPRRRAIAKQAVDTKPHDQDGREHMDPVNDRPDFRVPNSFGRIDLADRYFGRSIAELEYLHQEIDL